MGEFDLSGLVAAARRLADLSQRDLADASGVPRSTIAAAEAGSRSLQVGTLQRLLEAAGLRLAVVDADGREVAAFEPWAVRDNAGRRFPAHLDTGFPDVVDPYQRRPRYDRPARTAGFERRVARDARREAAGTTPARHLTPGEIELHELDRRYARFPAYLHRREAIRRRLGLPPEATDGD